MIIFIGGRHATTSPAASISSVTSATPSTDMRFAEYQLDKISYLLSNEIDHHSGERPLRAYSVGSRPDVIKYRSALAEARKNEVRDRALSLGSKSKKVHNRVLPPHGHGHGPKSSSAPLLLNSRMLGSHSSIDGRMGDLMEMDFSKTSTTSNSGYLNMTSGSRNSINNGYVDMQPGNIEKNRIPEVSPYVDMRCGSSPSKPNHIPVQNDHSYEPQSDYLDMDPKKSRNAFKASTSPHLPSVSPLSNYPPPTSYMDMNFNSKNRSDLHLDHYSISPTKSSISGKYSEGSPSSNVDYLDMDFSKSRTPTNEGYVEMSFGGKKTATNSHQRQSSLDGSGDYTNMSIGGNSSKKKEVKRTASKKETTRSLPIQIQSTTTTAQVSKG